MKKIKVFIVCSTLITFASCSKDNNDQYVSPEVTPQIISIPNGDFENWNNFLLQDWITNSCPICIPPYESYIVQRDSNSYQGAFAAKFIYNNVFNSWAEDRFLISAHPVHLIAYVKCNLLGTDTVSIKVVIFSNAVAVDSGAWFGTSSIGNYAQILIPISQNSSQADSAVISIHGGNQIGYPSNNTELWVDALEMQ